MAFQCVVVTPEAQTFDQLITQAIVPAHDGLIGILTGRAPILMRIGVGPLRLDLAGGKREFFLIDGGVAQMKDNVLTILTSSATLASEIDAEAARAEYQEALARKATDRPAAERREHDVRRARQKIAISSSR